MSIFAQNVVIKLLESPESPKDFVRRHGWPRKFDCMQWNRLHGFDNNNNNFGRRTFPLDPERRLVLRIDTRGPGSGGANTVTITATLWDRMPDGPFSVALKTIFAEEIKIDANKPHIEKALNWLLSNVCNVRDASCGWRGHPDVLIANNITTVKALWALFVKNIGRFRPYSRF